MANVEIRHQGVTDAVSAMDRAHADMVDALQWLEQNFNALRETLQGTARQQWDSFESELKSMKLTLNSDYQQARVVLQRMHDRQIEGDLNGRRRLAALQGA
ncbi:hypothetical protein [Streptomyces sp. NPDC059991]|uniref:hypothetical protein n=1 Tax=unclassified Streptomyces TaxID=2593676 RepID=UPI003677EF53